MGSDSEAEKSAQKEREKKKLLALAPIAKPLAGKKLCKRTLKLVRRAAEHKCLKRGVKEVVKSIRRGNKGICVIAGNISPIDVITHVPILCEEANIPYIYVTSKELIGLVGFSNMGSISVYFAYYSPTSDHTPLTQQEEVAWEGERFVLNKFNKIDTDSMINCTFQDLANAGATKRPTCCVLVLNKPTKGELGQEEQEKLKAEHDQVASDISELANSMF
ncbi:UNVERIFIED_CONTAM: H/ACA ribonucleoprotein complex subunit-like protein [Sesamum latifolium]|uniref:H/ACA ribonucleoprotein complex subunit 2 n=1 Tax=Sesamum latifolium TaxID=2727402 RepID=A0AAW2XIF3_9LAMI